MEVTRENFRVMIFYDFKAGLNEKDSYKKLQKCFPGSSPSYATVFRWFKEFKREKTNFKDDHRSGRPSTAVTEKNVENLRKIIKDDRHVTYQQIQQSLEISAGSVKKILKDDLGVRKVCSRWVPHQLTDHQRQARIKWCQEMLKKYNQGQSRRLYEVLTGDESWIYQFDPETKRQSTI